MRIAVLASNFIRLPPMPSVVPKGFSGAPEQVMHTIAESLVKRGHTVTLFASGDSHTSARLVSVSDTAISQKPSVSSGHWSDYEYLLISLCFQMANAGAFDIIHSAFDIRSSVLAPLCQTPVVSTLHSPLTDAVRSDILERTRESQWYVSISDSQRRALPSLKYAGTVYHGINPTAFPVGDGSGEYLLLAGRMVEEKGVDLAVQAALLSGRPLHLLGEPKPDDPYWHTSIAGHIDNSRIVHAGFVARDKLLGQYRHAAAFLFPIQWEEPFGLVMVEAMACGTPVIAYNRGSVSEIVKDGVTGFVIDPDDTKRPGKGTWIIKKQGVEGLVEAIARIGELDRAACRRHVEERFTHRRMMDGYEAVYQHILSTRA